MNRPAFRLLLCLLVLCALPALCHAQTQSTAPAVWKPDPKLLSQLGPEVSVGDYELCLPQDYTSDGPQYVQRGEFTQNIVRYIGKQRFDKSHNGLFISVDATQKLNAHPSVEKCIRIFQKGIKQVTVNYQPKPVEYGTVNGIPFARIHWQGLSPKTHTRMSGFLYVANEGKATIWLESFDRELFSETTLPLMEAAALTFRKG